MTFGSHAIDLHLKKACLLQFIQLKQ